MGNGSGRYSSSSGGMLMTFLEWCHHCDGLYQYWTKPMREWLFGFDPDHEIDPEELIFKVKQVMYERHS